MSLRPAIAAAAVVAAAACSTAPAAPPSAGVLVPGQSLGGVRLGWPLARVERVWGSTFGRCRDCPEETRYFNRVPFRPEGAAVVLRGGRVVAVLTLWAPPRWHTDRNVYVGEPERRVRTTHGAVRQVSCPGYEALVLRRREPVQTVVFVVDGRVWGFGLLADGERVCR
jgi:hypothetical protein